VRGGGPGETGDHTIFIAEVATVCGDPQKTSHFYYTGYRKLIGIGCDGAINMELST